MSLSFYTPGRNCTLFSTDFPQEKEFNSPFYGQVSLQTVTFYYSVLQHKQSYTTYRYRAYAEEGKTLRSPCKTPRMRENDCCVVSQGPETSERWENGGINVHRSSANAEESFPCVLTCASSPCSQSSDSVPGDALLFFKAAVLTLQRVPDFLLMSHRVVYPCLLIAWGNFPVTCCQSHNGITAYSVSISF